MLQKSKKLQVAYMLSVFAALVVSGCGNEKNTTTENPTKPTLDTQEPVSYAKGAINSDDYMTPEFAEFLRSRMEPPADISGSTSALNALKGKTGVDASALRVSGVAGSQQMDLGLPVYVQLKGDVDPSKTTEGVTGLVAYRFGNTAVGAIQSYANESETSHTETSLIAAQALGNMYIEGQLGTVSFEGGSGMRSQVRLGVDTSYVMPFVQLTHRDFGALSDTAAYVGLEVSALELKTSDYTFSSQLIAKAGHYSVKGNVGVIEGSAKLSFSHGLSVDTQVSFGSNTSSKLSLNVAFEQ